MALWRTETRQLLVLAGPVLIAQLSQTLMAFTDTVMAGAVSATDLAGVAVAVSVWFPLLLLLQGILMALPPTIAYRYGAGRFNEIGPWLWQGIYLALALLALVLLAIPLLHQILAWQVTDQALLTIAQGYLHGVTAGAPGVVLFLLLRFAFEGLNDTRPAMVVGFIGMLANIPLNWLFIHGAGPIPALGGAGCGWATSVAHLIMALLLLWHSRRNRRARELPLWVKPVRWQAAAQRQLLHLGLPIGSAIFFEVTLFALVALLLTPFGAIEVASHQVALNISSVCFMLPLSLAIALTIRVGTNLGADQPLQAFAAIRAALVMGFAVGCFNALLLAVGREPIALLYSDDPAVIKRACELMLLAAVFQIFDMLQAVAAGALRGLHDGKAIFAITLIAFWLVGLPIGWLLGRTDLLTPAMGASGFWIGFLTGLGVAAVLYAMRLLHHRRVLIRHGHEIAMAATAPAERLQR